MKFKLHEKLKYMFLGGVLTLAGFMFGNMNSDTQAQFGSETIDELTVRELIVLKDITVISDDIEPRVLISWDKDGGSVTAYGPGGKGAASLAVNEDGGTVSVRGVIGNNGASLAAKQEGGSVAVFNTQGNVRAAFSIVEGNGVAYLVNKFGESRVLEP